LTSLANASEIDFEPRTFATDGRAIKSRFSFFRYRANLFSEAPCLSICSDEHQQVVWNRYLETVAAESRCRWAILAVRCDEVHHLDAIWHWDSIRPKLIDFAMSSLLPVLYITRWKKTRPIGWFWRRSRVLREFFNREPIDSEPLKEQHERVRRFGWAYPGYVELPGDAPVSVIEIQSSLDAAFARLTRSTTAAA
jgi:hypothetical protein